MAATIEHHYATVNGVKLHYASTGKGPLMLFIHGFPEFWYAWKAQLEEFSGDYQAVALDMRGFNLSDKPTEVKQYGPKYLVEDVRQLIDHLGGKPAIVVAHDWGGAVAWNLAIRHPDYVAKLVIINSPHPVTFARALKNDAGQIAASQYMLLLRSAEAERVTSENNFRWLENMLKEKSVHPWWTDEDLARYREAWAQPGALTGSLNYYRVTPIHPASADEPGATALDLDPAKFAVTVPTLVIWAERDAALRPVLLDGLEHVVHDLTIKRIPEGSHWVAHEFPERVHQYIHEFLNTRATQ